MKTVEVDLDGNKLQGFEVPLPKAPLVGVYAEGGFVMCGYLNIEAANKMGVAAAVVRGVSTVDDLMKAFVQDISKAGEAKGIRPGMTGRQALACLV